MTLFCPHCHLAIAPYDKNIEEYNGKWHHKNCAAQRKREEERKRKETGLPLSQTATQRDLAFTA